MYVCVFAIGLPIGTGFVAEVTCQVVDQIVVSVGPYMFQRDEQRGSNSRANSGGSASPPQRIFIPLRPAQPCSISILHVAGVACMTVAPLSSISLPKRRQSIVDSRSAITRRAPFKRGKKISNAAMSKENVVTASNMSLDSIPGWRFIENKKLITARCSTCTPFGRPVEPDVKITYARLCGSTSLTECSRGCDINSSVSSGTSRAE